MKRDDTEEEDYEHEKPQTEAHELPTDAIPVISVRMRSPNGPLVEVEIAGGKNATLEDVYGIYTKLIANLPPLPSGRERANGREFA